MERETLLTLLVLLFGGMAMQPLAVISPQAAPHLGGRDAERHAWLRLWLPMTPTLCVAAWLCGWAMREPDPVRGHLDHWVLFAACLPFALIAARASCRAIWALTRTPPDTGVYTIGLFKPHIVFSPFLARQLDDDMIEAAWAHEKAHARHRDPLRIWLAQIATDLQWPWPWAGERMAIWLEALEQARDDEARQGGADGAALAAALLATVRRQPCPAQPRCPGGVAALDTQANRSSRDGMLERRVGRLLAPLAETYPRRATPAGLIRRPETGFALALLAMCLLGMLWGPRLLAPLLAWRL